MTLIHLDLTDVHEHTFDSLKTLLTGATEIALDIPCPSINTADSNLDLASDYLDAAFVGEVLVEFCEHIKGGQLRKGESFWYKVRFELQPSDLDGLTSKLLWLAPVFGGDYWWGDEGFEEVRDAIEEFADELDSKVLHFPELADSYMANLVMGEYDVDPDTVEYLHQHYPERRFDFWRSCASNNVGYDFYVSPFAWIVPHNVHIEDLLIRYGGFEEGLPALEEARYFETSDIAPVVFNRATVVYYPKRIMQLTRKCAEVIQGDRESEDIHGEQLSNNRSIRLSNEGNILMVSDDLASYITFGDELKGFSVSDIGHYLEVAAGAVEGLRDLLGEPVDIACPWDSLNDDQFEELCYDIIRNCGRYDPDRTSKLGKSRSRDGGRDIETYSRERIGKPSVKWLIQCKLLRTSGSLAGTNIQISDIVDQYGAGGFGVMTSGYIDSTLHDRMDAIGDRRGIKMDRWSRLELERFLARHPNIRDRYFPSLRR
jgi:hypothetical protein